ncbi:MAG: MATE family efflux transporter, partial [Treponema sp.]|nr:MATE family efflux transporter [Treponema sp.]
LPFFFKVEPDVLRTATYMLLILIAFYPFNSFCMNWVVGVCRAGGDTVFTAVVELCTLWLVAIPLGFLASTVLHLSAVWIYVFVMSEGIVKAAIGFIRVASGKWLHEVT